MINRDIGVANGIFMDNSPDRTGYNTEMKILTRLERMDVCTTDPHSPW